MPQATGGGAGLSRFNPAETARILWAFATLGHVSQQLLQGLTPSWGWRLAARRRVPKGTPTKGGWTEAQA